MVVMEIENAWNARLNPNFEGLFFKHLWQANKARETVMRPNPNGSNTNLGWTLRWCVYFQIWSLHHFLEHREKAFVNVYPNITKKFRSPVISLSPPRFLAPLRERSVKLNSRKCNLLHQRMQDLMERTGNRLGYVNIFLWSPLELRGSLGGPDFIDIKWGT